MWECWNGIFFFIHFRLFFDGGARHEVESPVSFVSQINIIFKVWPLDKICYLAIQDRPDASTLDDFFWFRFVRSLACTKHHWWWSRTRGKNVSGLLNGCYPFSFVFFCCLAMVILSAWAFLSWTEEIFSYTKGFLSLMQKSFDHGQILIWWLTGVFNISTRFRTENCPF